MNGKNKTCTQCKTQKPISEFYRRTLSPDGISYRCKKCDGINRHRTYLRNRPATLIAASMEYVYRPTHRMFLDAKRRAKAKGIRFEINESNLIVPAICPVLGIKIIPGAKRNGMWLANESPSLDRIIPSLGYVKGNVRVISNRANTLKSNATPIEIMKVCADTIDLALQRSSRE